MATEYEASRSGFHEDHVVHPCTLIYLMGIDCASIGELVAKYTCCYLHYAPDFFPLLLV